MLATLAAIVLYGWMPVLIWLGLREAWRREKRRERFREWEEKMFAEERERRRHGLKKRMQKRC